MPRLCAVCRVNRFHSRVSKFVLLTQPVPFFFVRLDILYCELSDGLIEVISTFE